MRNSIGLVKGSYDTRLGKGWLLVPCSVVLQWYNFNANAGGWVNNAHVVLNKVHWLVLIHIQVQSFSAEICNTLLQIYSLIVDLVKLNPVFELLAKVPLKSDSPW